MFTVSLKGVHLQASIGVYAEEHILNNDLEIDLSLSKESSIGELPFFDYQTLYEILLECTSEPIPLLEDLLARIVNQVFTLFPNTFIQIEIKKLNPPLGGEVAFSSVSWDNLP